MSTFETYAAHQSFAPAIRRQTKARGGPGRIFAKAFGALLTWQARQLQRAHLAELDDRLLRDMGLTRSDVAREAAKPFWRA